ncbi:hypothetical protein ACQI4E_32420 [Streptomyces sp. CA-252508]|uniref:hypothetical protein n=1 Tax=Streptomyces sp. CA-252508 TaxID=3418946 RepID=UPI003D91FDBF
MLILRPRRRIGRPRLQRPGPRYPQRSDRLPGAWSRWCRARGRKRRRREVNRVLRSDATLPEHDRSAVLEGLATRRQLRDMGFSPGDNQGLVAILPCKLCATRPQWSCTHPTRGFLLRVDLAKPKRSPMLAQEWALDRASVSASPRSSAAV